MRLVIFAATMISCLHAVFSEEPKTSSPAAPPTPIAQPTTPIVPSAAKPAMPPVNSLKPPSPEWVTLLERLRIQPRAGEINNGTLNASLVEVFGDSPDAKMKSSALSADYEKALLEKAAKWEGELKELRAQYETKMIAELPEAKRATAQKLLDASRAKWTEASSRDAKTRTEFMERMRNGPRVPAPGLKPAVANGQPPALPGQPGTDATAWMREQRMNAMKQDEQSINEMRGLLSPEDAARFDAHNRSRPALAPMPVVKPAAAPNAPSASSPPSPNVLVTPGTVEPKK